jgi:D-galactarolactone cycloisomerase
LIIGRLRVPRRGGGADRSNGIIAILRGDAIRVAASPSPGRFDNPPALGNDHAAMADVARIELHCFRHPLVQPLRTVFGLVESRPALVLRIEDSDGAEGFGEIWCNFPQPGAEYRARLAAAVLPAALAGLDCAAPHAAWSAIRGRLHRLALQAGEPGPADQIASGVDIALHDLAARRAGLPLAEWLGGRRRALPAYASGIDSRAAGPMMADARAAGFRAFKLRVGFGEAGDLAAVAAAAADLADGEALMVDANQAWDVDQAAAMAAAWRGAPLAWIEEPLAVDRPVEEWLRVRRAASSPIAGGENMRAPAAFDDAIAGDVFGVIQPDICKWGGLSACLDIARRAVAAGKRYCPHFLGAGVGLAASAHLLSAVGGDGLLEIDVNDNALREALAGPILPLRGHHVHLPAAPGLGYRPDVAGIRSLEVLRFDLAPER